MFGLTTEDHDLLLNANRRVTAYLRAFREKDLARWGHQDRRGRWVVVEPREPVAPPRTPGDGRFALPRRGRRFSSLSRARRFAAEVGGEIRRWHAHEWEREKHRWWAIPGLAMRPYCSLQR